MERTRRRDNVFAFHLILFKMTLKLKLLLSSQKYLATFPNTPNILQRLEPTLPSSPIFFTIFSEHSIKALTEWNVFSVSDKRLNVKM